MYTLNYHIQIWFYYIVTDDKVCKFNVWEDVKIWQNFQAKEERLTNFISSKNIFLSEDITMKMKASKKI